VHAVLGAAQHSRIEPLTLRSVSSTFGTESSGGPFLEPDYRREDSELLPRPGIQRFRSSQRILAIVTVTVVVGLACGSLSEWSIPHLPFTLVPLTNTAAPWIVLAFLLALMARTTLESLLLAVTTLLCLVLGFYLMQNHRGWAVSNHQVALWFGASFIAGPLIGLAARWTRRGARLLTALAGGIVGGILVGEAVHGLTQLRFSTPASYWRAQLTIGILVTLGLTIWRTRWRLYRLVPALAVACGTCAVIASITYAAYQYL
jgi:hypothetical protein